MERGNLLHKIFQGLNPGRCFSKESKMKKIEKYVIVSGTVATEVSAAVNKLIQEGWCLNGGISISQSSTNANVMMFAQSMIRYKEDGDKANT